VVLAALRAVVAINLRHELQDTHAVVTGERDYRVPYTQSLQLFTALQRQGVPSRLIVYANAGHWPSWYEMALYYTAHLDGSSSTSAAVRRPGPQSSS